MFRSRLNWMAGLLFLAHAFVMTAYRTRPAGSLLSNLVEFAFGALAFAAVYLAGKRSGPIGRWVWWFVAVAIAVWTVAQGIITYYENFLHAPYATPWPSDPLIFFWVLPIFMALFLDASTGEKRLDRVQILDFAQVMILMISAYVAYLYVPSQWVGGGRWMERLGWDATNVRDALLAGGLVIRALFARTRFIRSLFGRLAAFVVLYQIADLIYHYGEEVWKLKTGNPWDLLWSAPFVVLIICASTWQLSDESELAKKSAGWQAMRRLLILSSAFLPLPVLFVAEQLKRETPVVGSLLVAASLLCAASRLLITQRRRDRSEEALRHREEELKEAQRLARIGSWEWDVDSDAITWSDQLYRISRRDPMLPPPRYSEFAKIYPAETWERLKPLVENAVQTGAPYALEMERVHPDGTRKWFIARGEPVRGANGQVNRLRGTVQDITERKQAEVALQESEERFRGLSDASFEGVAYTDAGRVILANARLAEMLGCEMNELVGSMVSEWIAPESLDLVMEHIHSESEGTYEHFLRRKDRSVFPVESRARHMTWKGKKVRVTALHDLSERKRAEQMLRDLTEGTASDVGSAFFSSLVRHTARALHAKYTFVAERIEPGRARTLAFWQGDRQGENFEYELKGSPCQEVLHGTTCFHPDSLQALFPEDEGLAKLGAESYLGVPLFDSSQRVIGHMAVLDTRPMPDHPQAISILGVFAERAGAELERQRALDAVQNEKAFSDAVIDSLPGFVFVVNAKGDVVRWNKNAEAILGHSRDELLAMNTIDVITHEDREHVAEKWLEAFDKGSTTCEARVLTKDGKKVPFLLSAVRTGIGNDVYIIGTGIDIAQRKQAEEALVKLKKAVDTSGEVVFLTDPDGVFTSVNPKFTSLYGYTEAEVVGKATPRILKSGNLKAEDYAGMWKTILEKQVYHAEMVNRTKDGKPVTIETSISAIQGDRGEVLGFLAIQRDIAERKRAEAALQAEKAFSEALIDSIPGIFYVIDSEGRPVRWNRTTPAGLGYSNTELGSMGPLAYIPAEERARAAGLMKDAFQTGAVKTETNLLAKDGTKVPFIFTGVRAVIGEKTYLVGTGIDIRDRKRAEEALHAEKAFSEAIIDSLPGAFLVVDPQGRLIRWNKNVEDIGYSGQELASMAPDGLVAPEERALSAAAREKALAEGSATVEFCAVTKDGNKIPHFVSGVRADIGGKVYVVATGLNITERRRAEEALRESERRYRELVDRASDIIYETDRNGRFTFFNPVATRILGYSTQELVGRHYLELVRPDARPEAERFYRQQRKERIPTTYYQCPVVTKDGTEVWLGQHAQLAFDEKRVFGFRAIARDITKQKLAEDALVESEERFRQMAENSPDMFWLWDVEKQTVLYVSPGFEKMWGRNLRELSSNPRLWRDTVHPEDRERIITDFDTHAATVGTQDEFRITRPDGSVRWIHGRTFPIRDAAGQVRRLAGITYDVTERRQAEEALRHQEQLFHAIVEDQTEMIVRWKPDGTRTFVNEAYCRMFGRTQGELIGTSFYPHLVESDRDRIGKKIASLTPDHPTATDVHRSILPDNSIAWHEWTDRALFDEQGRAVEMQSVGRDITERKKAEDALTISEARYRTLIQSAPEAIVVLDAETGQFVDCNENATRLFGLAAEELLKVRPLEVSPSFQPDGRSSAEAAAEYIRKAAAGEVPVFEWMHRNSQGAEIPCEVRLVRLPGTGRTLLRGSVTDITSRKKAEAALQASQEMFSKAFHSSPEPMGIMQLSDWTFLDANQAACDLIGFTRQEIVGHTGRDLGLTAVSKVSDDQLQSLARGDFRDQELELKVKSGEIRTVLVSLEMVEIGGRPCILAQGRDVTEHRRAVNALQASDRRYRDFISHSQEGVWRVELEEPIPLDLPVEKQIEYLTQYTYMAECNDAMARIVGLSRAEELVGMRIKDLIPLSDQGRIETYFSAARGGWQNRTVQFEAMDRKGRLKHLQRTEVPIIENGKLTRIWGVTRDVTDLHNAEEAVRASGQRYRLLFERSVAGVLEKTFDGRLLECNDAFARIQGYNSREELLAAKAKDFYLERADGTALSALLRKQPLVMGQEFQTRRKDGSPVWMLVSASLVEHEKAEPTILATAFDITQWKELGEQLRQSQKMEAVGRLAGGVAHDFNNMLQIINGYSELVIDQLPADDPSRSHVYEIKSIVDRAAGLTRQLLAFSRQQVLAPRVMDLNAAIANLSKMLRRLIGEDVELILTEGRPLSQVKADPGQIDQVILNLAVNARDAMPQGGKLAISTSNLDIDATYALAHYPMTPGPYVLISVSDTGHGMSAETQARIFEPFFTTKETGKGTGLGLATVYGIVKQSGGFIWVESEVGKGTTFKIYLPPAAEPPAVQPEISGAARAHGTETVLLVEDEEYVRSLVRRSLQSKGYTVLEARNGKEALRVAQQHPGSIDLLISDVVMPGMSGRELSEQLVPLRPHLKTIFMSGYTDDSVLHRGIQKSGEVLLQKPFTAETLALKVRQVLESA